MRLRWVALSALAIGVCAASSSPSKAYAAAPQAPGYVHDQGGWDAPPAEYRDAKRQGFHDGIEGARKDYDHHRHPDVRNREEYRHPHVDHAVREDYREGYRHGYDVAMRHMMGEAPMR
jgi:hypothetical protein